MAPVVRVPVVAADAEILDREDRRQGDVSGAPVQCRG
jgi:hypothetical protein